MYQKKGGKHVFSKQVSENYAVKVKSVVLVDFRCGVSPATQLPCLAPAPIPEAQDVQVQSMRQDVALMTASSHKPISNRRQSTPSIRNHLICPRLIKALPHF